MPEFELCASSAYGMKLKEPDSCSINPIDFWPAETSGMDLVGILGSIWHVKKFKKYVGPGFSGETNGTAEGDRRAGENKMRRARSGRGHPGRSGAVQEEKRGVNSYWMAPSGHFCGEHGLCSKNHRTLPMQTSVPVDGQRFINRGDTPRVVNQASYLASTPRIVPKGPVKFQTLAVQESGT